MARQAPTGGPQMPYVKSPPDRRQLKSEFLKKSRQGTYNHLGSVMGAHPPASDFPTLRPAWLGVRFHKREASGSAALSVHAHSLDIASRRPPWPRRSVFPKSHRWRAPGGFRRSAIRRPMSGTLTDRHGTNSCPRQFAARTMARMPARIASGSFGQASTIAAKSGS